MISARDVQKRAEEEKIGIRLVFKECIHFLILEYLFRKGLFSDLVFQGGTALRVAYQGVRYSEDLDFVVKSKNVWPLDRMSLELKSLALQIRKNLPFVTDASVKVQKETGFFKRYSLVLRADFLGSVDRTNIEIANVVSYQHQAIIVRHPAIALSPAVVVESKKEILSDKIVAFAARDYIKGRDIWDIYFLTNTLKVYVDEEVLDMVKKKIWDYGIDPNQLAAVLKERLALFERSGVILLHEEMDRFLPWAYRSLFESQYPEICSQELYMLKKLFKELKNEH